MLRLTTFFNDIPSKGLAMSRRDELALSSAQRAFGIRREQPHSPGFRSTRDVKVFDICDTACVPDGRARYYYVVRDFYRTD